MDCFTLSRLVFLFFIVSLAVYFIVSNKKNVESFTADPKTATTTPPAPTTAPPPPPQTASNTNQPPTPPKTAPSGGSTDKLSNTDENPADPKVIIPDNIEYLPKDREVIRKTIEEIYMDLYKQPPSETELEWYTQYAMQRSMTREQLKETIEISAPTLRKTLKIQVNEAEFGVLGTEDNVIAVFNEILQRNPSREEMFYFAKMMHDDKDFDDDRLRQILIASDEYRRMEKTQTNMVYMNLQGNITDRQLTLIINKLYKEATNKEYIDEDTLKFLKRKFIELNLDEDEMRKFIKAYVTNTTYQYSFSSNIITRASDSNMPQGSMSQQELEAMKLSVLQDLRKELGSNVPRSTTTTSEQRVTAVSGSNISTENFQDAKNVYSNSSIYNFYGGEIPSAYLINSLSKHTTSTGVNTNDINKEIKDNANCVFSKDTAYDQALEKNKQELADYINDRNMSHLKNVCVRNKKYINADDNMVLYPEYKWSVPQKFPPVCMGGNAEFKPSVDQTALIGTLLTDATETSVGSILPPFPPV